jgi:hypothetical protein
MCGKALPFRKVFLQIYRRGSASPLVKKGIENGKPEAFRTSGGTAAIAALSFDSDGPKTNRHD